jgi:hypothetical protein
MEFIFSSMADKDFEAALDATFKKIDEMSADDFLTQAISRSSGQIAGLMAASVDGPQPQFSHVFKFSFSSRPTSFRWDVQGFVRKDSGWPSALQYGPGSSDVCANDEVYYSLLAA